MQKIYQWLGFDPKKYHLKTELMAGLTTFLTMSYILAVNPDILSAAGMDRGAVFTATALASAVGTLLIAFMAKLPFAQAPSMGINAFFAFTLVQAMGYSWEAALAAIFVEGIIFILLTLFNIREQIVKCVPINLRFAISSGIGMFIAFIGLKNAGIIVSDPATFVALGEFTPTALLAMMGIILSGVLMVLRVKGALFYSIIIITIVGIQMGVTHVPSGFSVISMPQSLEPTFLKLDFHAIFNADMALTIFALVFMDIFNTMGTLIGAAANTEMMDKQGNVKNIKQAMMADAIATSKTVVWNGPMGVFEFPAFAEGTKAVAKAISESDAFSVIGGGDSAAAVRTLGFDEATFSHISTGGGASLELLEGKTLPGIAVLND